MNATRFKLKQDEDCHWYLIIDNNEELFVRLLEEEDYDTFGECFGDCRVDGPHNLTFTDPREE